MAQEAHCFLQWRTTNKLLYITREADRRTCGIRLVTRIFQVLSGLIPIFPFYNGVHNAKIIDYEYITVLRIFKYTQFTKRSVCRCN